MKKIPHKVTKHLVRFFFYVSPSIRIFREKSDNNEPILVHQGLFGIEKSFGKSLSLMKECCPPNFFHCIQTYTIGLLMISSPII